MERTDKLLAMLPQGTAALLHNASNIFYLSAYTGEGRLLVASGIRAVITGMPLRRRSSAPALRSPPSGRA